MSDRSAGVNEEPSKEKRFSEYDMAILTGPKDPRPPDYFPASLKEGIEHKIDLEELYAKRDRETLERYHGLRHYLYSINKDIILEKSAGKLDEMVVNDLASTFAIAEAKRTIYAQKLSQEVYERYLAEHQKGRIDPLTRLPLRVPFFERLREQIESGVPYGILFIDIDHFKQFNDIYGHDAGDLVLTKAAERVLANIRPGQIIDPTKDIEEKEIGNTDFAARFGGEEIVVLVSGVTEPEDLAKVGTRIVEGFNLNPFELADGQTTTVTASVGGALPNPTNSGEKPIDVIKRADKFLYDAKDMGRNRYIGDGMIIDTTFHRVN